MPDSPPRSGRARNAGHGDVEVVLAVIARETDSNFGFNLPWWDRLFGTCRAQPAADHGDMVVGLRQFRDPRLQWLWHMLALPFTGAGGEHPIGRRRRD